MIRLTPVVKNLIIINVILFLAQLMSPMLVPEKDFAYCLGYASGLKIDVITGFLSLWNVKSDCFQPFQLFTYMFLHDTSGFLHIFFNMLALAFMGPILETYWGPKKFTIFYMVTGIGAGCVRTVDKSILSGPRFHQSHGRCIGCCLRRVDGIWNDVP